MFQTRMSALREHKTVWEENGRLRFAKPPPNPEAVAAAKEKPLVPEAYEKCIAKEPSREERKRAWPGYKGKQTLCKCPAREIHTPREWRRIGIEPHGKLFRLVTLVSRLEISEADLRLAKVTAKTHSLPLAEALRNGAVLDAAMQRLHEDGAKPAKKAVKQGQK